MAQRNSNQLAFWESIKYKYEKRNDNLRKQEVCLRKRLEQLKQLMEKQQAGDDCDCVPEKLEKTGLVQCLVEKGKNLILGSCKCGDPKTGEQFFCACHISDPDIALNVDPNLCPIEDSSTSVLEGCPNTTCEFYNPLLLDPASADPSTFSLKQTDLYYMNKLAELVKSEKSIEDNIVDLEKREHSYLVAINDFREAMRNTTEEDDPLKQELFKMTENMEEENKTLRNELEDLRLELKHCFERVEGPLKRSLEDQKDKCSRMEREVDDLQTKMSTKEDSYLREINEIKAKLCNACCTMVDLNSVNAKLKDDFGSLQNKCADLEDELLKQKLKEAENIMKFKNALYDRKTRVTEVQSKGDDSEQDLGNIARKLSATLKEICPCVTNVPSGLTDTAKDIKQLTDFVKERKPKKKGKPKVLKNAACSCSSDELIERQRVAHTKYTEVACSVSSAALEPVMKPTEVARTGPDSLEPPKKTASVGCSCCLFQAACEPQNEQKASPTPIEDVKESVDSRKTNEQKATPAPTLALTKDVKESVDTICSSPPQNSQKTGPSEEVIAVKNLGTLSSKEMLQTLKKKKLKVKTSCDIIYVPPKDVHVVTTVAETGSIEIVTEGPPGIVQTKVNYLPNGKVEILTKLIDKHNMDAFLDGTLLPVTPSTQPDENKPSGGQDDDTEEKKDPSEEDTGSTEQNDCGQTNENNSESTNQAENEKQEKNDPFEEEKEPTHQNNCGQTNDNNSKSINLVENEKQKCREDVAPTYTAPYGNVVINNTVLEEVKYKSNPFLYQEWKNENFNSTDLFDHYYRHTQNIARHDENEIFNLDDINASALIRLSRKQSLTYVEQQFQDNCTVYSSKSSRSLPYTDILETISEGNEEEHSSKTNNDQIYLGVSDRYSENQGSQEYDIAEKSFITESCSICSMISKEENLDILESTKIFSEKDGDSQVEPLFPSENSFVVVPYTNLDETALDIFTPENTIDVKVPQSRSSNFKVGLTFSSIFNEDEREKSQVLIESSMKQCNLALWELNGRFENKNLLRGNIRLKYSKSMYENNGQQIESLRLCKSAVVSLGQLKINFEKLKFSSEAAYVGDYGERQYTPKTDNFRAVVTENHGESDKFKCSPIPDQTIQCFVCSCSKAGDKENTERKDDRILQQRIDDLLEINPLTSAEKHGSNCSCIDCLYHITQSGAEPSAAKINCRASKKRKAIAKNVDSTDYKCKSGIKMTVLKTNESTSNRNNRDDDSHDKNCTCVDCICNPCNFKRKAVATDCKCKKKKSGCHSKNCECGTSYNSKHIYNLDLFELSKPPEITVMSVNVPCDCLGKCLCDPCMDSRKKSTPKVKTNKDTPCDECSNKKSGRQPSEHNKSPATTSSSSPENLKNVKGACSCKPETNDSKGVCTCKVCECKPCEYERKARPCDCAPSKKAEKNSQGNEGLGDGEGQITSANLMACDCETCECSKCLHPKARTEAETNHTLQPNEVKPPSQEAPSQSNAQENSPELQEECFCVDCRCDPCKNLQKNPIQKKIIILGNELLRDGKGRIPSATFCDCGTCKCAICLYPKARAEAETYQTLQPNEVKPPSQEAPSQSNAQVNPLDLQKECSCIDCRCNPCQNLQKIPIQDTINILGNELLRDGIGQIVPATVCDCETCKCAICPYPKARAEAETNQTLQPNEVKPPSLEIPPQLLQECPCIDCRCNPCKNLQKKPIQEAIIVVKKVPLLYPCSNNDMISTKIGDRSCECEQCNCLVCYGNQSDTNENDAISEFMKSLQNQENTKFGRDVKCDCAECQCGDACPDKSVKSKSSQKNTPPEVKESNVSTSKSLEDLNKVRKPTCCAGRKPHYSNQPLAECKCCCLCQNERALQTNAIEQKKEKGKKQELISMEYGLCCCCENEPPAIGDAERAKHEIKQVLDKIGCTCERVENNFKPLLKKASNFEATISKMLLKLNNLQQKCTDKDQIINAMAKDLGIRSRSGVFANLLKELSHPKDTHHIPDFTRTLVCDYLPKPKHLMSGRLQPKRSSSFCRRYSSTTLEPILEIDRYIPNANVIACCNRKKDLSGMEITDIRRVTIDSILIKWRNPDNIADITGYQIFVNDILKYRVLTPNRSNAVIDSLDLSCSVEIKLFAMTNSGRCEPPALATYKI